MEVRCHTPFAPFAFKAKDADDRGYDVVVVKATFDLVDDNRLKISQSQEPVTLADRYFGEPNESSVERESDLKPFKPRTDVVVIGDAHAPGGRPTETFFVDVRLGEMNRPLRVHGPRAFRRSMGMFWSLSSPEPCTAVPLRYEHAFGGRFQKDETTVLACPENPIGVGYAPERLPGAIKELPAPQIEDPHDIVEELGRAHRPVGYGFFGRAWQPRLRLAGTYDDTWKETQWPLPPRDFDEGYNQVAHPDLIYPRWLEGGEPFSAMNLTPSGRVSFEVPRWRVDARFRYRDGVIERHAMHADTLVVDLPASKVMVTYRTRIPERASIRVLEICGRRGD